MENTITPWQIPCTNFLFWFKIGEWGLRGCYYLVFFTYCIYFSFFVENNFSVLRLKDVGFSNQDAVCRCFWATQLEFSSFCELAWTSEVQSITQVMAQQQECSPLWETSLREPERMSSLNFLWALQQEKLMEPNFRVPWNKLFCLPNRNI